mmetsp:Transcript_107624/g.303092  ORF Transcript_107624/g.303092 Transcript_107624/m.303092 type:complete len:239 (+) Transcript_107624:1079-1795(+)
MLKSATCSGTPPSTSNLSGSCSTGFACRTCLALAAFRFGLAPFSLGIMPHTAVAASLESRHSAARRAFSSSLLRAASSALVMNLCLRLCLGASFALAVGFMLAAAFTCASACAQPMSGDPSRLFLCFFSFFFFSLPLSLSFFFFFFCFFPLPFLRVLSRTDRMVSESSGSPRHSREHESETRSSTSALSTPTRPALPAAPTTKSRFSTSSSESDSTNGASMRCFIGPRRSGVHRSTEP